ncbi:photosystem I reaction center subunit XII [Candidatus Gracilibacteria bacterium]|jgi:phycocyanin-associated, rod|nr:photosystem I reaction center subunit XII [Candidatus Gracilibacteria bacterium]NJM88185.1 photosystem I reaction center subunit XII [Hydrococcus sp. RU_2_2]NJP19605.1 photosystem I reaction center subunit XII [Hydrococcus sp. CRU_1_1]NJQ98243.1 photosystem I reaction center subunit XII [Hydrococcus sp. CSU_1_8]
MLGQSAIVNAADNSSNSRVFVYEVTGLRQNIENDSNNYQFRSSDSVFIKVPYKRMNQEMQRILRMGGTIVNIKPLTSDSASEN